VRRGLVADAILTHGVHGPTWFVRLLTLSNSLSSSLVWSHKTWCTSLDRSLYPNPQPDPQPDPHYTFNLTEPHLLPCP